MLVDGSVTFNRGTLGIKDNKGLRLKVLQSKNVSIKTIDEHIHLNEELSKHGLSPKDTGKLLNVIKNLEQQGFDTKKIVGKAMNIKTLKDSEKRLRNNCEMLANRIDRHKDTLPLAEKIVAMRINTAGLLSTRCSGEAKRQNNIIYLFILGVPGNQ